MKMFITGAALLLTLSAFGQGGQQGPQGGYGGMGGLSVAAGIGQGKGRGGGGQAQQTFEQSAESINSAIGRYLDGEESRSILTPGEYCEWKVDLKKNQVIVAEARSDAFDPALEIVDEKNKVLAGNDDRFLGDQRPLLLYRCSADGTYLLHVRCFHDKSGGLAFMRYRVYDCADMGDDAAIRHAMGNGERFLIQVPLKAGDLKTVHVHQDPFVPNIPVVFDETIFEDGLPNLNLAKGINDISFEPLLFAPVTGNYFVFCNTYNQKLNPKSQISISAVSLQAKPITLTDSSASDTGKSGQPAIWEVKVKAGQLLEVTVPDLSIYTRLAVTEKPDISKYSLDKPEMNPFYPQAPPKEAKPNPLVNLRARQGDGRRMVFAVIHDTTLWIGASGTSDDKHAQYTFRIAPGAKEFSAEHGNSAHLRIGDHDYWAFDAKAGDILAFKGGAKEFRPWFVSYDPHFATTFEQTFQLDQIQTEWRSVVRVPGRCLIEVSAVGDGASGGYELERTVLHATEFGVGKPAVGRVDANGVQVLKFTAQPHHPLYLHFMGRSGLASWSIYNERGENQSLPLAYIDDQNAFGILNVAESQTFVMVLRGSDKPLDYRFELTDLPGYKAGVK